MDRSRDLTEYLSLLPQNLCIQHKYLVEVVLLAYCADRRIDGILKMIRENQQSTAEEEKPQKREDAALNADNYSVTTCILAKDQAKLRAKATEEPEFQGQGQRLSSEHQPPPSEQQMKPTLREFERERRATLMQQIPLNSVIARWNGASPGQGTAPLPPLPMPKPPWIRCRSGSYGENADVALQTSSSLASSTSGRLAATEENQDSKKPKGSGVRRSPTVAAAVTAAVTEPARPSLFLNSVGQVRNLWINRVVAEQQRSSSPVRPTPPDGRQSSPSDAQLLSKRWRSVDALTASLVAVTDPAMSPTRSYSVLGQTAGQPYSTGAYRQPCDVTSPHPWYDSRKIRQAVSHESISNINTTREMWHRREQEDVWQRTGAAAPTTTRSTSRPVDDGYIAYDDRIHDVRDSTSTGRAYCEDPDEIARQLRAMDRAVRAYQMSPQNIGGSLPTRYSPRTADGYSQYEEKRYATDDAVTRANASLDREKELLITYIQQHGDVVDSMGISVPAYLSEPRRSRYENLRVELCAFEEKRPRCPEYLSRSKSIGDVCPSKSRPAVYSPAPIVREGKYVRQKQVTPGGSLQRRIVVQQQQQSGLCPEQLQRLQAKYQSVMLDRNTYRSGISVMLPDRAGRHPPYVAARTHSLERPSIKTAVASTDVLETKGREKEQPQRSYEYRVRREAPSERREAAITSPRPSRRACVGGTYSQVTSRASLQKETKKPSEVAAKQQPQGQPTSSTLLKSPEDVIAHTPVVAVENLPVVDRIEQEIQNLLDREEELKRQRERVGTRSGSELSLIEQYNQLYFDDGVTTVVRQYAR